MSTVYGAVGEGAKNGITLGACGCCACVAVVDPCGLGQALKACNHGRIDLEQGTVCASIVQGFDELGLGLGSGQRLAREVAAG